MECTSHHLSKKRYPHLRRNGKFWTMSRYIYTQKHGSIPKNMQIRHTCDNPTCINVEHLLTGTQCDNMQDMVSRNRQSKGETSGTNKLTENEVREIRKLKGLMKLQSIADKYHVAIPTISNIFTGRTWKQVRTDSFNEV